MDMTHALLVTLIGWWLGGFVNGIAGFGAALVAMPLVAFGNDMALAVTSCGLVVLALNVQMAWNYRGHLDCSGGSALFTGGIPGAVCGVLLLRHVPESGLKLGLGVLLIAYALWGLCGTEPQPKRPGTLWGMLAGFFRRAWVRPLASTARLLPSICRFAAARNGKSRPPWAYSS